MSITMKSTKPVMFAEIQRLNAELKKAQATAVAAVTQLTNVASTPVRSPLFGERAERNVPAMPAWQRERAAAMAAAKAQAMQFGVSVKV